MELAALVFLLAAFYVLRFGNFLMACIAFVSFLSIVFYGLAPVGDTTRTVLPFMLMAISLVVYGLIKKYKHQEKVKYYKDCCTCVELLALVVLYVAANYYVVREVSNSMFDLQLKEGDTIPGGWIFWILTVLIPVLYVLRGIQKKDVIILRIGLLLVAAMVVTVRYYYYFMSAEMVMTLGGLVLMAVAYGVTKYLTPPKRGFTHAELNNAGLGWNEVESLVVAESFGEAEGGENRFEFGGGSSGGAGANGEY